VPTFTVPVEDNRILLTVAVAIPEARVPERRTCRALVDTGAQCSMVSASVVEALQVASTGISGFMAANGQTQRTPVFDLHIAVPVAVTATAADGSTSQTVFAGGRTLEVLQLPFDPADFEVLLGMDLLTEFHITMYNGTLILSN